MADARKRERMAFRIPVDVADGLRRYADAHGVSMTDVVSEALSDFIESDTRTGTQTGTHGAHALTSGDEMPGTHGAHDGAHTGTQSGTRDGGAAIDALTAQLDVKDRQIARLMDALSQAQETAHAAQLLEGAHVAKALGGDVADADASDQKRGGVFARLRRWLAS